MQHKAPGPTRAPLRWAGSKRKSLPILRGFFPKEVEHYVEPFAGSACMAFEIKPKSLVLGDINPQLIEFYSYLNEKPTNLHRAYIRINSNPETYYIIRDKYNKSTPSIGRAAKFLYLNRHCFNGIYRVNTQGKFNVPWGGDKVGNPLTRSELKQAASVLKSATFVCDDFEAVIRAHVKAGTFVYLDPPYATNESRVFREYHEESFSTKDWIRLKDTLKLIDERGGRFLLSYAGPASLTEGIDNWNAGYMDVTRNVGGFRASRRKYREFIATNYPI